MKAAVESPIRAEMDSHTIWLPGVWLCSLAIRVEKESLMKCAGSSRSLYGKLKVSRYTNSFHH